MKSEGEQATTKTRFRNEKYSDQRNISSRLCCKPEAYASGLHQSLGDMSPKNSFKQLRSTVVLSEKPSPNLALPELATQRLSGDILNLCKAKRLSPSKKHTVQTEFWTKPKSFVQNGEQTMKTASKWDMFMTNEESDESSDEGPTCDDVIKDVKTTKIHNIPNADNLFTTTDDLDALLDDF